ncbi:PaREP1 family protein [Caldivirga sp.]|uniref:PaREP1 family protein n=1 Tax=Caldivirga sp. TaxID=2080243 RepID=UPI00345C0544
MEVRVKEALYEFELAERFLENGLYRNAAGKAFQGWKATLAALAANSRNEWRVSLKVLLGYGRGLRLRPLILS